MATKTPSGRWRARAENGTECHSCTFTTKRAAEIWEHDNRQRLRRGEPVQKHVARRVGEFFRESYEELYVGRTKSWEKRERLVEVLINTLGEDKLIAHLTAQDARNVHAALLDRGIKATSVANYSHIFNKFMERALELEETDKAIRIKVKAGSWDRKDRMLTEQEEAEIIAWLRPREGRDVVALTRFLIWSGARISEALRLKVEDLDKEANTALFKDTKSGDDRKIPLSIQSRGALDTILEFYDRRPEDRFFDINYHQYYFIMKRCFEDLGLDDVTIHTFRHTTASRLAKGNMTLQKIGVFLGHKRITTTERYAHLKAHETTEIADALNAMA